MFKRMTLAVLQPQIKTSPNFQQMNKLYRISPWFYMKNENVTCFPFLPQI